MEPKKYFQSFNTLQMPADWEINTLNDSLITSPTYGLNAPAEPFSEMFPKYLRITDITDNGSYSNDQIVSVSAEGYESFILEEGDLVFARTGASVGKSYLYDHRDGTLVFAGYLIRVRTDPKMLIPEYLKYFVQSKYYWDWVATVSMRSGQPGVNATQYGSLPIFHPSKIEEQRAIAEVLSDVDALIEAQETLIQKKRLIKQGVMHELLTGKRRLPGFSGEWAKKSVSEMGIVITGGTPPTKNLEYWGGDVPWITPTDITRSRDIFCSERLITEKGLNYLHELPPDSVLVTCIASIGKNAILRTTGACNQQINAVIPNENNNPEFLYYLFEHNKDYLLSNSGITATRILSKNLFSSLIFNIPYYEEQKAISNILCDLEDEIFGLIESKNKIHLIKQGMMHELLTGRIRLV